jgi:hypothetical protein
MIYTDMTDEEYDALDEELTCTVPQFGPEGSGWLSRRETRLSGLNNVTLTWLRVQAEAAHKSPAQIINDLVFEKIAAAAEA